MRFTQRRRRQPPAVIIISLIDILIVLLIFLMVTTTFKQRPSLKLRLPESRQATRGTGEEGLVITVNKQEPFFYLRAKPVTLDQLQELLKRDVQTNSQSSVTIYSDAGSTIENVLRVMDAAHAAGTPTPRIVVKEAGTR